jgi:DNA-binding GntR family transcriptional regulator
MSAAIAHKAGRLQAAAGPYEKLKLMILDGELAGGEPLVERPLAERLGVSRTPVRETIFRLEREGLVRVVEGKGAFVASYTLEDMIEIYQMREGLEPLAARLACQHLAGAEIDHHEAQLKRYRARPALRQEDPGKWRLLGRDFHNMFIRASKNARLIRAIEGMQHQIELFRGLGRNINPRTDLKSAVEEHWEILQALRARNPQRAEKAVRAHLQNGLRYRLEALHGGR